LSAIEEAILGATGRERRWLKYALAGLLSDELPNPVRTGIIDFSAA